MKRLRDQINCCASTAVGTECMNISLLMIWIYTGIYTYEFIELSDKWLIDWMELLCAMKGVNVGGGAEWGRQLLLLKKEKLIEIEWNDFQSSSFQGNYSIPFLMYDH